MQAKKGEATDSAGGGGASVEKEQSSRVLEDTIKGIESSTNEVAEEAAEQMVAAKNVDRRSVVREPTVVAATDRPDNQARTDSDLEGKMEPAVKDLARKLVDTIEAEKMTVEEGFDAIAQHYGRMSLFDLSAAISRVKICEDFKTVEKLFQLMETRGTGMISKEGWRSVLSVPRAAESASVPLEEMYQNFMIKGTSRYNSAYYCNASISFVKGESPDMSVAKVQYQVWGDNSLGPLQDPEDSSLSVDSRKLRPVRTRRDRRRFTL